MTTWNPPISSSAWTTHWAEYRAAKLADPETPITRFDEESNRGAILLDALRKGMGDERFFDFMKTYFAANTTKAVTAGAFWKRRGPRRPCRWIRAVRSICAATSWPDRRDALIVYGTVTEASREPLRGRAAAEASSQPL